MAQNIPSNSEEISNRSKVEFRRETGVSNPFLARSWIGGLIVSLGNRMFEFFLSIVDAELEITPLTAIRKLTAWCTSYGFTNNPGGKSAGTVWIDASSTGLGITVPSATKYEDDAGNVYSQTADAVLVQAQPSVDTFTASGTTATVTTDEDHGLSSNAIVTMSGASPAGYNLSLQPIIVNGPKTFTYEVASGLSSPATGTPAITIFGATANLQADVAGAAHNADSGTTLNFQAAIPSVETTVQVGDGGMAGGSDDEDNESKRGRLIFTLQNPVANFNDSQIEATAKTVAGVTRVFIERATPAVGQVTIYFMRDNDDVPIPNPAQVADVRAAMATIEPVHMAVADVIVSAPTAVTQAFTFTALNPDTPTMRLAIAAQIEDYFKLVPEVGVDVTEDAYRANIINTIDTDADGARVVSFTITESGDLTIASGEIGQAGTVAFTI